MAFKHESFFVFLAVFSIIKFATARDPDITSDFTIPPNVTVDANFFTHNALKVLVGADPPTTFKVLKASQVESPTLNGQSVSYAVLQYPAGTINPPHTHPRSAELLFLLQGSLEVGFVDTYKKLYTQTLQAGDMFLFPKGLIHYQYNADAMNLAITVSSFGSRNVGTVSIPSTVFTIGIDDTILAMSFKTNVATIQAIKASLATKA